MIYDADLLNLIRGMDGSEPCTQTDPDLWTAVDSFTTGPGVTKAIREGQAQATRLCQGCHLRDQCAAYAMTHPVNGVWGGASTQDRQRLHDNAQKDAA